MTFPKTVPMSTVSEPSFQTTLWGTGPSRSGAVETALKALAEAPDADRGAVQTRPAVAAFVLDLAGYTVGRGLHKIRVLEPSFGDGVFLREIVRRLLEEWQTSGRQTDLTTCVRAVEVHRATFDLTRSRLRADLAGRGVGPATAEALLDNWLRCDDFLLTPFADGFDAVVGNPPYVRHEAIPAALMGRYRRDYRTVVDRADLYVPFIERGLSLLKPSGRLSYICADRWMKNRYGRKLRSIIAHGFSVRHIVQMHGMDAFGEQVDAYPSVFTIAREARDSAQPTAVVSDPPGGVTGLESLARQLNAGDEGEAVEHVRSVVSGSEPWILGGGAAIALLRDLEQRYPTLEQAGGKAGIGVATGADRVYIGQGDKLPVEPDRVLPLAMAKDARPDGTLVWSGRALVNPFDANGELVDLAQYPRLRAYFEAHEAALRKRHVARKTPSRWYRTIDKVTPGLASAPKLLIPDIKGSAVVAYDKGRLYPHHNLYVVTSSAWELRALQAVLRSRLAEFQVAAYSVRMRGGYLRFQAQYLRRIRLPEWDSVPDDLRLRLATAARADRNACDAVVRELYGLSRREWDVVTESV